MSATRIHDKFVFECDGCGDILETDAENFAEAQTELRKAGWRPTKVGTGIWQHECQDCSNG